MLNSRIVPRISSLCRALSQIQVSGKIVPPVFLENGQENQLAGTPTLQNLQFSVRSISIIESPLIQQKEIIDRNILNLIIDTPTNSHFPSSEIEHISNNNEIIDPALNQNTSEDGIQAARLIVIRRKKMKKHKLKKLRKKMKFEWAKVRQRREMRKEKAFQAGLIAQIKAAERFSAEAYVADKIRQATDVPIPRFWKGKRLPQFLIKEKLGIK